MRAGMLGVLIVLMSMAAQAQTVVGDLTVQGRLRVVTQIGEMVFDGNELSNCDVGWGEGLTVAANSANWEITNNRLVQCSGIDAQGHFKESSDPGTDQARNGVIRGNVVSDSGADGVGIYVDGAKDVVAANLALARVGDKKPRRTTP